MLPALSSTGRLVPSARPPKPHHHPGVADSRHHWQATESASLAPAGIVVPTVRRLAWGRADSVTTHHGGQGTSRPRDTTNRRGRAGSSCKAGTMTTDRDPARVRPGHHLHSVRFGVAMVPPRLPGGGAHGADAAGVGGRGQHGGEMPTRRRAGPRGLRDPDLPDGRDSGSPHRVTPPWVVAGSPPYHCCFDGRASCHPPNSGIRCQQGGKSWRR